MGGMGNYMFHLDRPGASAQKSALLAIILVLKRVIKKALKREKIKFWKFSAHLSQRTTLK